MSEMHLRQPGFTYSACGPFTKSKEKIEQFIGIGDSSYIYGIKHLILLKIDKRLI